MKDKFFSKLDWAAFWTATLVTFAVYFYTLGPSVGLEDSGELATAGAHLGVPHPPGYPFWTLCSWIFCKVFSFVTYMGHPTPAWCISLFSATAGAFAAGFTAMLICRSSRDFIEDDGSKSSSALSFGGAVAGALAFSLSPVEWSQSTIVEVYSLNAFFLMWVFLLTYRWMRRPSDRILWLTAFVFGLGLTNYQVLLFAIVPLALAILMTSPGMFRDVFLFICPAAMTYQVLQIGQLARASRAMQSDVINKHLPVLGSAEDLVTTPSTAAIVVALVLLVGSIAAAAVLKRRGQADRAARTALFGGGAGAATLLLSGLVFTTRTFWSAGDTMVAPSVAPLIAPTRYALIAGLVAASAVAGVLAALAGEENPERQGWFKWDLSPRTVKYLVISAVFAFAAVALAAAVPAAGNDGYLGEVYPWGKSTAMFWAAMAVMFALTLFTKKGLAFAIPAAGLQLAAFTLLSHGAMNGLTHPASWWFWWPIAWNFVLLALAAVTLPNGISVALAAFFTQLGVSFYAYMPIVSDWRNPPMNWGYPRTWEGFKHAIMRGQYEAISFQLPTLAGIRGYFADVIKQFTDVLAVMAVVPFALGAKVVKRPARALFWKWMLAAFSCFLLMSVLLIGLANVKGDIQDGFIQKVKFISSHAMIALWIGYGLVFIGALLRRWIPVKLYAAAVIVMAFAFPVYDNYCNDRIVFELGGAEQNGHTFGWQFGAYQLDGASAIAEQLVADEEPLPDPSYPPAMDEFSIFFGGTDPGRFVPTYMIYSAAFRPDVYLITQNALADDTYMSVQRDLYGDEIWIPAKEDSAQAFNIYVDEVQRGVRPANGDLKIANGRVQVTGALGVMEINGILTKMMFDHDRLRHSFYVEESYVIPWMYPYLSPHGLIMKINPERKGFDPELAAKDADFWDWYVRRLLKDPMYRRDFAGQKSFSKLRAAIAGLYVRQGRLRESAQAFREACILYPASPEATFRYIQECLLPYRQYDIVDNYSDFTDSVDPNNRRTASVRDATARTRRLAAEIERLQPKLRNKTITPEEARELAECYYACGRVTEAAQLVRGQIDLISDPATLRGVATILLEAHLDADAERFLSKYLRLAPDKDAISWIELAKLQARGGRMTDAQRSFVYGYRLDKDSIFRLLQRDEELYRIAAPLFRQAAPASGGVGPRR